MRREARQGSWQGRVCQLCVAVEGGHDAEHPRPTAGGCFTWNRSGTADAYFAPVSLATESLASAFSFSRRGGLAELDVQLAQPRLVQHGRRAHHQVLRVAVERERDRLADVRLVGQQHHDAVDTGGDATVRRGAETERAEHARELVLDGLTVVTGDLERLDHQLGLVVTDGAGGQLDAVADDVVLPGEDVQRVLRLQVLQAALRHGERVVREVDPAGLLVLLVHREVDDPAEPEDALLEVVSALGGLDPDGRHDLGDVVELMRRRRRRRGPGRATGAR